jgi:uncharacterized membrane protein
MDKDKKKLILMAILTITLLFGVIASVCMDFSSNILDNEGVLFYIIPLILVVFMVFFIARRYRDIKNGMPLEDERSKQVITKAAATSFQVTLYWLLAISIFEPFFAKILFSTQKLDASQTVGGAIAGMAVFFFIFWFYYDKKGKLV